MSYLRLKVTKSKNAASLYVIKSVYNPNTQTNTSVIVEKLGTEKELREKLNGADPYEWARQYIEQLNQKEKEQKRTVLIPFKQSSLISKEQQRSFNGGYLFLQSLYHSLALHQMAKTISEKYRFSFNFDAILSRLLYGRILFPSSKLSTFQQAHSFLEPPDFELQHVYRALEFICKEMEFIQAQLYQNSKAFSTRNDQILFYDCTNFFFEIEQEEGLKQYGPSKESRPNPIVEMGLFMDGDGIPLAFSIHKGNENEQKTLIPLEKQIIRDFSHSRFVVCTDAGLSSFNNREFNNCAGRSFLTAQSVKKLKTHLKEWALEKHGWHLEGDSHPERTYDISSLETSQELAESLKNQTFYKERWINEHGLEQRLIVTFSLKYKHYQRSIRTRQIERAEKLIKSNPSTLKKHRQNDCKRFISRASITSEGELAEQEVYSIDEAAIQEEEQFDGFYAVCTNLESTAVDITRINRRRWEIEECFRIMKTDFQARPVYLSRDDRIKAHFTTCFLSLVLFRYLEKELNERFTSTEIIRTLREMNFLFIPGEGYIPTYTRTDLTDALHEAFGFRTDYQIVSLKQMKKIFRETKKAKKVR